MWQAGHKKGRTGSTSPPAGQRQACVPPVYLDLCRTWAAPPRAPCGNRAGSCWAGIATPSQPPHSWATEDDGGQPRPQLIQNMVRPLLHYGHYLGFPALQSSLKQRKIVVSKSDSYKFWPTHTPSYISKQHAFLHCSGIKPLPVVFLPCYPMESYPLGTEVNKSALVTWLSKLTYLCCKCKLVLCSEAKLWVKENLVLQQTIKSSNPVSKKSLFCG